MEVPKEKPAAASDFFDKNKRPFVKTELVANLPLQMAIYFNAFYSPFWFFIHIACLYLKFHTLDITYKVIVVAIHVFDAAVEITRLYLGFVGNLNEKIPSLAGFWITTLILQLPVTSFLLLNPGLRILPLERVADIIHLIFVVSEILFGMQAVRQVARNQVVKFQQQVLQKEPTEKLE